MNQNNALEAEAVEALNAAKTTTDEDRKEASLRAASEILLHRDPVPGLLLAKLGPAVLEFQVDMSSKVRRFVASFVEDACKAKNINESAIMHQFLPAVINLAQNDEAVGVLKKCILVMNNLYRRALGCVVRSKPDANTFEIAKVLPSMANALCKLLNHERIPVSLAAARGIQTVILSGLTSEKGLDPFRSSVGISGGVDAFSLGDVPRNHPHLSAASIEQAALSTLETFCDRAVEVAALCSETIEKERQQFLQQSINTLNTLALNRATARKTCCETLEAIYGAVNKNAANFKYLANTIKQNLIMMLKNAGMKPHRNLLLGIAEGLGVKAKAEQAIATGEKSSKRRARGQGGIVRPSKIARVGAPFGVLPCDAADMQKVSYPPTSNTVVYESGKLDLGRLADSFSTGDVADVVIANMANLPPSPRTGDKEAKSADDDADGDDAMQGTDDVPPSLLRFYNFVCGHITSQHVSNRSNAPVIAPASMPKIPPLQAIAMRSGAFSRILSILQKSSHHIDSSRDGFAIAGIMSRIACDYESPAFPIKGLDLKQQIIDHAFTLEARKCASTLLTLLNEAYATSLLAKGGKDGYEKLLIDVIKQAVARDRKEQGEDYDFLLSRLILRAPAISEAVMSVVHEMCVDGENSDAVVSGLRVYRDVILRRPGLRNFAFNEVCTFCTSKHEAVQNNAIRLTCNQLLKIPLLAPKIVDYAKISLAALSNADEGVSEGEQARRMIKLALALCPQDHSMLRDVLGAFVGAGEEARAVFHEEFKGSGPNSGIVHALALRMGPGPLLDAINEYPEGCENLVLQILEQLAERKNPPEADVVSRARTLRASGKTEGPFTKDARFLVPLLSGLQREELKRALPSVLTLPKPSVEKGLLGFLGASPPVSGSTPAELFISIVNAPAAGALTLKHLVVATDVCFSQKQVYTQQLMATILEKLVQQPELPTLLMRVVIKSAVTHPKLKSFIVQKLSLLATRNVWENTHLWTGFKRSMKMFKPLSVSVLFRLPAKPLREVVTDFPELKELMQAALEKNESIASTLSADVSKILS